MQRQPTTDCTTPTAEQGKGRRSGSQDISFYAGCNLKLSRMFPRPVFPNIIGFNEVYLGKIRTLRDN